jgi:hypothetical protein
MQEKHSQTINFDKSSEITPILFLLFIYVIPFFYILDPPSNSTAQNLAHLINQNAEQENCRPKLVALSDQTEIQKLGESDMEISDADSETATIVIKKEDEPIIFKKKSINPLPSPEPTKFSGVVPKPLPGAKSLVTGADRAEPERTRNNQSSSPF